MIDRLEDVTPEALNIEAFDLEYTGRAHAAQVMRWAAERIRQLEQEAHHVRKQKAQTVPRGPRH